MSAHQTDTAQHLRTLTPKLQYIAQFVFREQQLLHICLLATQPPHSNPGRGNQHHHCPTIQHKSKSNKNKREYMFIVFSMFCCGLNIGCSIRNQKSVDAVITLLMLSLSHYNCSCFRMSKYSGCKSYLQDSNICQMLFLNNWSGSGVWRSPGAERGQTLHSHISANFPKLCLNFHNHREVILLIVESAYKHFYIF